MDSRDDSSRFGQLCAKTTRNMSSSSSTAFISANQSPFFSPRSPKPQQERSESTLSDAQHDRFEPLSFSSGFQDMELQEDPGFSVPRKPDRVASTSGISNSRTGIQFQTSSYNRMRCCDVFIGLHGRKPSLLRFAGWLRAELEVQGMSCFMSDRFRCKSSRKHRIVERAMDSASFGVIILTRKSFKNPYTIEELRFFLSKKNLVPIFFDLSPGDCLVRDIVEKRGDLWEKQGGELWVLYGGIEKEWKEAVHGLSRVDEWKLEAHEGNWRDCIFRAVTLLAMRLGRRSIVERLTKWRDKAEKEEFPYPRNENFVGRKKELSELEFFLFGDIARDSERDYFELKARPRRKNVTLGWNKNGPADEKQKKGKEKVVWKESEKEIEMQSTDLPSRLQQKQQGKVGQNPRRKRSMKVAYGKGVACVSGDSGIGKTELLLEFAYRHHQRYKMVLWIGGESRYIRQNYLNLYQYLEVDVGVENCSDKTRTKSFEEQEEAAISRIRKELMRNIPFLVIIDNLESEKDWWDSKLVMDLLPRFGCETHILISTRLSRVMNMEPLKLSYLSAIEAMSLMQGNVKDYPIAEIDALRATEEKLGRLTLGLAIVGTILSELPINPSRLLDTINRMPLREISSNGRDANLLRRNMFLLQLFEVCFSIFDHADGPRSLATRMVMASAWFGPAPVPVPVLALAANKLPDKNRGPRLRRQLIRALTCGFTSSYAKRSESEAASMLLRFNIARTCSRQGFIHVQQLMKLYARTRVPMNENAPAMVQAVINRASISETAEHIWAACFLLFGFSSQTPILQLKISELLFLVKQVILPLAIRTFITFSRCSAALELLRVCTNALEAADQTLVMPVEKWLDKSLCWRPVHTNAQLNPALWQELALARATVLETRAKLMLRGGQFGIADDLIRKAIFIRTSISGEDHPLTVSARETLSKLTRLLSSVHQIHNASP
ncbi:PREDICTED: uncharacterized protein LOC104814630 [Tarenaya hassleriana]|uniref:uncharacterized protein LOC104814630 n=1 Tax=Tarenaya hassleriana TaxID=28532 RepID=UPI00053C9C52|nr:PREDICTED: uncharacterized protein LOC104814630 [Tarenaya hassleriana]